VGLAEGKLPKMPYPKRLPPPADLVRARFDFARALLDAQRDFVSGIVQAVTPLVTTARRDDAAAAAPGDAGAGGAGAGAAGAAESAEPAPKTAAEPAAPRTTATKARARKAAGKTTPPSTPDTDD
jgi:hypothetical protein